MSSGYTICYVTCSIYWYRNTVIQFELILIVKYYHYGVMRLESSIHNNHGSHNHLSKDNPHFGWDCFVFCSVSVSP